MEIEVLQTVLTADDRDLQSKLKKAGQTGDTTARGLESRFKNLRLRMPAVKGPSVPSFGGGAGGPGVGGGSPSSAGGSGDLMSGIKGIAGGNLLSGAITGGITALGGAMKEGWQMGIQYNSMLENANVRLKRFFATGQETGKFVEQVEKFAADSPVFQLDEALTGAQRLLDMKFAANEVIPALAAIGDAVGGVGGNAETIDRVTLALSQMSGKGKIQAEEMQQLVEAGLPAWELLAKAIGKTEAETRKLAEQGRIRGGAVKGIIAMAGEKFAGQSEAAGKTFSGLQSQLESAAQQAAGKSTKGNFEQYKEAMKSGLQGLGTQAATEAAAELDKLLTDIGKKFDPALKEFASGRYFESMRDSINNGRQAAYNLEQGNLGAGLNNAGQAVGNAVGMQRGARGEEQTASNIVGKMDDLDKRIAAPVVKAVTATIESRVAQTTLDLFSSAMSAIGIDTGRKAQEYGTNTGNSLATGLDASKTTVEAAGAGAGTSLKDGVEKSLQMRSPSRVMIGLGQLAAESLVSGFNDTLEANKGKVKRSPIDVEKMRAKLVADLEKLRDDPRIKAMLDTIAKAEGTGSSYNMKFGGGRFADMSQHPNDPVTKMFFNKNTGKKEPITSTAAGRYQFLKSTWDDVSKELGLTDFSEKSQDLAAIRLMQKRGMVQPLMDDDPETAYNKGNREWASLPGSPYGQPTKKAEELTVVYNAALERYNEIASQTGTIMGSLSSALDTAKQKITDFTASLPTFGDAMDKLKGMVKEPGQTVRGAGEAVSTVARNVNPDAAAKIDRGANAVADSLDAAARRVQQAATGGTTVRAGAGPVSVSQSAVVGTAQPSAYLPTFQDANAKAAQLAKQALTDLTNATKGIPAPTMAATLAMKENGSRAGEWANEIQQASSKFGTKEERFGAFQERLGQGFDRAIDALITGGERWQDVAKNIGVDFFNSLASEMMLSATGGKYGSIGGMLGGLLGGVFGGMFGLGGAKAEGGPVSKGETYLVGEKGPELFKPDRSGTIIPSNDPRTKQFRRANAFGVSPSYAGAQSGAGMASYSPINNPGNTVSRFSVGPVGSAPGSGIGRTTYQGFNKGDQAEMNAYNAFGVAGAKPGRAADGAMIRGAGTSRSDKIPMWLSNGEYVTDAQTVEILGPDFFRSLPQMAKKGYKGRQAMMAGRMADGGLVAASGSIPGAGNSSMMPHMPPPLPTQKAQGQASGEGGNTVVNNITINVPITSPNGNVSRQTQQQIATQTGQAVQMAMARNS